jgi:PKD repeat protein
VTGLQVSFTDSSSGTPAPVIEVNWDDGTVSYGAAGGQFNHTYALGGVYTILLTAASENTYDYKFMDVTITATTGTFTISGTTTTSAMFVLKDVNTNATLKVIGGPGGSNPGVGSYSFNVATGGTYTVQAYKPGQAIQTTGPVTISGNVVHNFTL